MKWIQCGAHKSYLNKGFLSLWGAFLPAVQFDCIVMLLCHQITQVSFANAPARDGATAWDHEVLKICPCIVTVIHCRTYLIAGGRGSERGEATNRSSLWR